MKYRVFEMASPVRVKVKDAVQIQDKLGIFEEVQDFECRETLQGDYIAKWRCLAVQELDTVN